jgi:uncharacterized membrane protein
MKSTFNHWRANFLTGMTIFLPTAITLAIVRWLFGASQDIEAKTLHRLLAVLVPATPNLTSGFLILVPEEDIIRLEMSVAHGIKYILSLAALAPEGASAVPVASRLQPILHTPPAARSWTNAPPE